MSDVTQSREAEQRLVASEPATRALADEQAALRRIATLVAGEARPAPSSSRSPRRSRACRRPERSVLRYESDEHATVVGSWRDAGMAGVPLGSTLDLDGDSVVARVFRSGDPSASTTTSTRPERSPSSCARSASGLGRRSALRRRQAVGRAGRLDDARREACRRLRAAAAGLRRARRAGPVQCRRLRQARRARARASWRPATPSGGDWSATCTTAPSSGSCRSRCSCAWSRAASRATPTRARQDLAEAREQLTTRSRSCASSPAASIRRSSPTAGWPAPLGASPTARRCRWRSTTCPTSACPSPSRPPPTT